MPRTRGRKDFDMSKIIYASKYGFSPENDGATNAAALQKMLDIGGEIVVDGKGVYDVEGTVFIHSDTTLSFCAGSYVRRISCGDVNGPLLINSGAFVREYDSNIKIYGLNLIVNGVECSREFPILGVLSQVCFYYTKHTVIKDFICMDLGTKSFCIQICTFEDSLVENVHIEGMKDAVHYGPGRRFILRNGVFRTFDDPIALNANDYAVSNPQMGWIEDGLIEFCYDLNQPTTTGFFCRLLAGAWQDWREGMVIRNSDTVVSGGRMYRAAMPADGAEYISKTPPTHEEGAEIVDGIKWVMTQNDNIVYNCGCRKIHFKDIFLQKVRPTAFAFHFDNDVYSHSFYPNSTTPVQTDITFENIYMEAQVDFVVRATTPVGSIKVINSYLENTRMRFAHRGVEGIEYGTTDVILSGNTIRGNLNISSADGIKTEITAAGNIVKNGELTVSGDAAII